MNNVVKIKYKDDNGLIHFIKSWRNFTEQHQGTAEGALINPASERIKRWGGEVKVDEYNKNYLDYYIEFDTEEHLTMWLLRWA